MLCLGAILLACSVELVSQPPVKGMSWTSDDSSEPVRMSGDCPAPGVVLASNVLRQADHEIAEGYFNVGEGFSAMMPPKNPLYLYVTQHRGKQVEIVLRPIQKRERQEIVR